MEHTSPAGPKAAPTAAKSMGSGRSGGSGRCLIVNYRDNFAYVCLCLDMSLSCHIHIKTLLQILSIINYLNIVS